jgi:hypothetical protein
MLPVGSAPPPVNGTTLELDCGGEVEPSDSVRGVVVERPTLIGSGGEAEDGTLNGGDGELGEDCSGNDERGGGGDDCTGEAESARLLSDSTLLGDGVGGGDSDGGGTLEGSGA